MERKILRAALSIDAQFFSVGRKYDVRTRRERRLRDVDETEVTFTHAKSRQEDRSTLHVRDDLGCRICNRNTQTKRERLRVVLACCVRRQLDEHPA